MEGRGPAKGNSPGRNVLRTQSRGGTPSALERVRQAAEKDRRQRGGGKPETFNFLGFTHSCAKTRAGKFTGLRQAMRVRWRAKLEAVKAELRRRLHDPIPEQGAYLRSVVMGHVRYCGVPLVRICAGGAGRPASLPQPR